MFRKLLKEYMLKNDINQVELSELLGDTRQAVSDFLSKKGNPQKKTKEKYFNSIIGFKEFYKKTSSGQANSVFKLNQENIPILKKEGVEFSIEEVSLFFAKNQDDFLKQKIISNIIEMKVSKKLALLTSNPKLLKEYLEG